MKSRQFTPQQATTEEALEAFNTLVKDQLLAFMKVTLGTEALSYLTISFLSSLLELPIRLDEASGRAKHFGLFAFEVWSLLVFGITTCWGAIPLAYEVVSWMTNMFPHWSGWKEWTWICTTALCTLLFGLVLAPGILGDFLWKPMTSFGSCLF